MPDVRQSVRLTRAMPFLISLKVWLEQTLPQVSVKSGIAKAIKYSLTHWQTLTRYCEDGHIEVDNNTTAYFTPSWTAISRQAGQRFHAKLDGNRMR